MPTKITTSRARSDPKPPVYLIKHYAYPDSRVFYKYQKGRNPVSWFPERFVYWLRELQCIIVECNGKVVGRHVFLLRKARTRKGRPPSCSEEVKYFSEFTWVSKSHRRRGLAFEMWRYALELTKPKKVILTVASRNGVRLLDSLEKEFPEIEWISEWNIN